MTSAGLQSLAKSFPILARLQYVNLQENMVSVAGVTTLSDALRSCVCLEEVNLERMTSIIEDLTSIIR